MISFVGFSLVARFGFPQRFTQWASGGADVGEKRESWQQFDGVLPIWVEGWVWVKILGRNRASIADKITGDTKYFLRDDTTKVYPKSCTTLSLLNEVNLQFELTVD